MSLLEPTFQHFLLWNSERFVWESPSESERSRREAHRSNHAGEYGDGAKGEVRRASLQLEHIASRFRPHVGVRPDDAWREMANSFPYCPGMISRGENLTP